MKLPSRRVRAAAAVVTAGTLAAAGFAVAGSSLAAPGTDRALGDNGGATRNSGDRTAEVAKAVDGRKAKNVILLIGDGMGDSEITLARNYAEGAGGRFAGIDALPLTGQYTTYSVQRGSATLPDYVPDSSATGSAWATGTKTYDNGVSVNSVTGAPQKTILELAKEAGLKTGNITTSEIQDATPAVEASHISQRGCYGPLNTDTTKAQSTSNCPEAALSAGGLGSITEQFLTTRADVTMGGGLATFAQSATGGQYAGQTLESQAKARGFQFIGKAATTVGGTDAVVGTKSDLDKVTVANQSTPLLALFATGNMPVRYTGPTATKGGDVLPAGGAAAVPGCTDGNRPTGQPSLADMTSKAISLLNNDKGFFLQVEGASIDKRDHASDVCGQIGETVDLDEAVQQALAFAKADGNTSVFVTADHAHTSQIVEVVPNGTASTTPGSTVLVKTKDGVPMAVSYATSTGSSQQHTGTQLRIAGYGPQAANIVGLTDQTDLFFTMRNALFGTGTTTPTIPSTSVTPAPVPPVTAPSSAAGKAKVLGSIRVGQRGVVLGSGFLGDKQVKIVLKQGKKKITRTKSLSAGAVGVAFKGLRAGTYKVKVKGVTSGVTDTATLKVTRR